MERLTEYDEFGNAEFVGIDNTKLYERLVCDETVALTIATNKLAEFEDFMEEQGFESLEDLENVIGYNYFVDNQIEYIKQVRKEVCDKIRENAISHNNLEVDMYYITPQQLYEIEKGETK